MIIITLLLIGIQSLKFLNIQSQIQENIQNEDQVAAYVAPMWTKFKLEFNLTNSYNCTINPNGIQQQLVSCLNKLKMLAQSSEEKEIFCLLQQIALCNPKDLILKKQQHNQYQCVSCSIFFTVRFDDQIIQNYVNIHNQNVQEFIMKKLCIHFDGQFNIACKIIVSLYSKQLITYLIKKQHADKFCFDIDLCNKSQCLLHKSSFQKLPVNNQNKYRFSPWNWFKNLIKQFDENHLPIQDLDNDTFSLLQTFRGYHWKGKECNDLQKNIYPGRKSIDGKLDYDCNKIFGEDQHGINYQEKFCSQSKRYGVALIGDSAGAHFQIPQNYFNASQINQGTYKNLFQKVADEFDLPHLSGYTGFTNLNNQPSHSVYKYLRKHNLCNNNDYQNIGVNGGDSNNTASNIKALRRNQTHDHPLIVFYQLIGNDVCVILNQQTISKEKFKSNVLKQWQYLDSILPSGSHMFLFALADGGYIYNNLYNWTHPLNVTYAQVYDYLNCLGISPCQGWLNTNQTIRKKTFEKATELNQGYSELLKQYSHTFKNFDIAYYQFPMKQIIEQRIKQGGIPQDLIQRSDGFHPNGLFHSYLADWIWDKINKEHHQWIGQPNPHNQQIKKIFNISDQL